MWLSTKNNHTFCHGGTKQSGLHMHGGGEGGEHEAGESRPLASRPVRQKAKDRRSSKWGAPETK